MGIIQKSKSNKFSGCIKINSKNGGLQFIETNAVEIPLDPINLEVINSIFNSIRKKDYTGTLILKFNSGELLEYAYTRYLDNAELDSANL